MTSSAQSSGSASLIQTAACLIIGDEILGGKTQDTNGHFFAKYCFDLGITLKRIEVIPDDEDDIIEAVRRMSKSYDFVITSGGIGPTHDDITYASIAKAFKLSLKLTEEGFRRMRGQAYKPRQANQDFDWETPSEVLEAKKRMLRLPLDESRDEVEQVLFPDDELWIPLSCVNGNVYIFPGIPSLQQRMLNGLKPRIADRVSNPEHERGNKMMMMIHRVTIATPMYESEVAGYLSKVSERVASHGVRVGSYPSWGKKRNTVVLTGRDLKYMEELVPEIERSVKGKRVYYDDDEKDLFNDAAGDSP
ncbi:hypothetical protein KEM54_001886 [Ascosphaera aggregata]|nr:hypothetical protein KEM54_001886 [Ascosphaera aggregata]